MSDWKLEVGNEWQSRDPFGEVKTADRSERSIPVQEDGGVTLRAARNGYASFRLWASGQGEYRLNVAVDAPLGMEEVDVRVFDALGRTVHASRCGAGTGLPSELDVRRWAGGCYTLMLSNGTVHRFVRFMVSH